MSATTTHRQQTSDAVIPSTPMCPASTTSSRKNWSFRQERPPCWSASSTTPRWRRWVYVVCALLLPSPLPIPRLATACSKNSPLILMTNRTSWHRDSNASRGAYSDQLTEDLKFDRPFRLRLSQTRTEQSKSADKRTKIRRRQKCFHVYSVDERIGNFRQHFFCSHAVASFFVHDLICSRITRGK